MVLKHNNLELLLATLLASTAIAIPRSTIALSPHQNLPGTVKVSLSDSSTIILSKKSGGRSGGGSFKSRPSRSQTSSPSRSYKSKSKSTTPSSKKSKDRNFEQRDRQYNSTDYYPNSRNYPRGSSSKQGGFLSFFWLLLFLAAFIVVLVYILRFLLNGNNSRDKIAGKIARERDNDRVTVSLVQVVLSSGADKLQQDLTKLSTKVDTGNAQGLVELMGESVLLLLRNQQYWTHVFSSSQSFDISQAESEFNRLSLTARSKFSNESLSNVDGQLQTEETREEASNGLANYLVVTLILGTADDNPLFESINTEESLQAQLLHISSLREDYLLKLELLWTPQTANQYLTDEELLLEYPQVRQIH